jgi:cell division protein DivIC
MKWLHHIPSWLKNKYFVTALGFLVWITFFDERDLLTNLRHRSELKSLEKSRDQYAKDIAETRKELEQLQKDPAMVEKYAREKYRMKRDDEDIFIVSE